VEFYHPEDIPHVRHALEQVTATSQPSEFRLRIVTPKGELRHVRATLLARKTQGGEVTELFGTFSDISAVQRASEIVRQQKEQFERVFHTVPVRLWVKDLDNRILSLNSAAQAFLGVSREVAEGASVSDFFPATAGEHHAGDLRAVHEGPQLARVERYERADGTIGWVRTDRIAYTDPESGEQRILLCSVDVTREKHAEQALHARSDALHQANEDLEEFVRAASHDLRAPMRAISNLSVWLCEDLGADLEGQAREYLELLGSRTRRLEQLLLDLREYSLAGRSDPQVAVIHLEALVRETFDLLGLGSQLTLQTEGLDRELRTATTPLGQVLRNLMDNAAKHHDRKQGTLRVSARALGDWLEISVADDGPGIAIEHQERVFRSFVTLRSRDELESSGMGLATIKKLVNLAGGEVYLESSPETGRRGATFRFGWPIVWVHDAVDEK
ncbi:MAG: PAS domain-containing sensor histidine kinase, partial [Pseudomonadota bacterium]